MSERTADRETIARALAAKHDEIEWEWLADQGKDAYRAMADTVLAVVVPADQIRAETMDEASEIAEAYPGSPMAREVASLIRRRAAEYRKVTRA